MSRCNENFYSNSAFKLFRKEDVRKYFPLLLTDSERLVFNKRYDEDGNVELSMREVGRTINISSARVSSIMKQINNKVNLFSRYEKNNLILFIKLGKNINDNEYYKNYYNRIKLDIVSIIDKYNNKEKLNPLEKVLFDYYCEIDNAIDNYSLEFRFDSKTKIIIEYIKEKGSLPSRGSKDFDTNLVFDDGRFLRYHYDYLYKYIFTIFDKKKNGLVLYPHEKNILYEYVTIKTLLNKKKNLNSADDKLDSNIIQSFCWSEKDLIDLIEKVNNNQHINIIKDSFGLRDGVFKNLTELANEYNSSAGSIFKIIDSFKNSVVFLDGLSNIQIISMLNEERKKVGKESIISNNLRLLLDYIDSNKNCDNEMYYKYLKKNVPKIIKKIDKREELDSKEKQILLEYELVQKKKSLSGKKGVFIRLIHEYRGIFTKQDRNSLLFDDGSGIFYYYYNLRFSVSRILKKQADGEQLLYKEQKTIEDYYEIKKVFDMYSKNSVLVDTINKLHRLPKRKTNGINEAIFEDGTDQYNYYINLKNTYDGIVRRGKGFTTLDEIETLDNYNMIQEALFKNDRVSQLIDIINTVKRAPLSGEKDVKFFDGSSSYLYYMKLREKYYNIIINNNALNYDDKMIINSYLLVKKYIDKYSKKRQLIDTIKRIKKIPTNDCIFKDGTNQKRYYYNLMNCAKKLEVRYNNGELLNLHDLELIDEYHEIHNILSYFIIRKDEYKNGIKKLCSDNNINIVENKSLLNKSVYEIYVKIKYLLDNNLDIVDSNGVLNNIFYMSDVDLYNEYNVSLDDLINIYINGNINSLGVQYQKKAIKK